VTTSRRSATLATLVGTIGNSGVVAVQAIVLVPLYLRVLGPGLYGAWLGTGEFLVWLQAFDLGLPNLMIQRIGVAHARGDTRATGEWLGSGLLVLCGVAAAVFAVALGLSTRVAGWMSLGGKDAADLRACFVVAGAAAAVALANNGVVAFSRAVQETAFMNAVVVVSSLAGFVCSLLLLLGGAGLWAVALGSVARVVVSVAGSGVFLFRQRAGLGGAIAIRAPTVREMLAVSPLTGLGGLGYAVMNHGEVALAALCLGPPAAAVLSVTRKALDLARTLLDSIAAASYGSFAHLVASGEPARARAVYLEVVAIRASAACVLAAAYALVNASLVDVWVGPSQNGGPLLIALLALQAIVTGGAYLANTLYRAAGGIVRGSVLLIVECGLRVPLAIGLSRVLGLPGLPIAAIIASAASWWVARRWIRARLEGEAHAPWLSAAAARWAFFAAVAAAGMLGWPRSWTFVLVAGTSTVLLGSGLLASADPAVRALATAAMVRTRGALRVAVR
jgi:O-antigen/teichoic acid export membrane protein